MQVLISCEPNTAGSEMQAAMLSAGRWRGQVEALVCCQAHRAAVITAWTCKGCRSQSSCSYHRFTDASCSRRQFLLPQPHYSKFLDVAQTKKTLLTCYYPNQPVLTHINQHYHLQQADVCAPIYNRTYEPHHPHTTGTPAPESGPPEPHYYPLT